MIKPIEKVIGPYLNKRDNRAFVILVYEDGSRKTTSAARYLVEKSLNRSLEENEFVYHKDRNKGNCNLDNLEIRVKERILKDYRGER